MPRMRKALRGREGQPPPSDRAIRTAYKLLAETYARTKYGVELDVTVKLADEQERAGHMAGT